MYSSSNNEYYRPPTYNSQTLTKTVIIEPTPDVAQLKYGGITDVSTAKSVAKRIFERYDRDRDGFLSNLEVTPMISDAYLQMNRRIAPSKQDVDSFFRICDRNKDGRINYEDIESLCVKYLTTSYEIRR